MTGIVERLRNISRGDHERGCQGREYICSCDYDETSWRTAEEAADEITRLRRELEEARRALQPFAQAAAVIDALPAEMLPQDTDGARGYIARLSPTIGDLRHARAAIRPRAEEEGR